MNDGHVQDESPQEREDLLTQDVPPSTSEPQSQGCIHDLSIKIQTTMESWAYRIGVLVSSRPKTVILSCVLFTCLCSLGFLRFEIEELPEKLWIPKESRFLKDLHWIQEQFPFDERHQFVIVEHDVNILSPKAILQMAQVNQAVTNITVGDLSWTDVCVKLPSVKLTSSDHTGMQYDPTFLIDQGKFAQSLYCSVVNNLPRECWARSILELWNYDLELINNLTDLEIVKQVNEVKTSSVYGIETDWKAMLSGITEDEYGRITGAKASLMHWAINKNFSLMEGYEASSSAQGLSMEMVDPVSEEWENAFVNRLLDQPFPGLHVYVKSMKSFMDESEGGIVKDIFKMAVSVFLMYTYISIMMGKFNLLEHSIWLSCAGVCSIILSVVCCYGIGALIGLVYSPVHNLLPLLLQGLGVDDMFVTVQCWYNLPKGHDKSLSERMGQTLRHAGVAITVTSLTDFAAFLIGASTVLPCLSSFCIYSAIGILLTYCFQITFFVACFTLDQRRVERRRCSYLPCIELPRDWKPPAWSDTQYAKAFLQEYFGPFLMNKCVKALVLLMTAGLFALSLYGTVNLVSCFDLLLLIPADSYVSHFLRAMKVYFPSVYSMGGVFFGGGNLSSNTVRIDKLTSDLSSSPYISFVSSWYDEFQRWANVRYNWSLPYQQVPEAAFQEALSWFLWVPRGAVFQRFFSFSSPLLCGELLPELRASRIDYSWVYLNSSEVRIEAMESTRQIADESGIFSPLGFVTAWSFDFISWEITDWIMGEVGRNMGLALACVALTTLFLLSSFSACFWVLLCVALTLINITGMMYLWGLHLELITGLTLTLSVGLCVDYAAHIAHAFLVTSGSRDQRAITALGDIGPAVLNGAFSTFLSFVVLYNSTSYVFLAFFKIFFSASVFGVYHGMVFLPVILSLLGPKEYAHRIKANPKNEHELTRR